MWTVGIGLYSKSNTPKSCMSRASFCITAVMHSTERLHWELFKVFVQIIIDIITTFMYARVTICECNDVDFQVKRFSFLVLVGFYCITGFSERI